MTYAIGIDLGGTRIKAVAVTPDGDILEKVMRRTDDDEGDDATWQAGVRGIAEGLQANRDAPADHIGVAGPGIAAPDGRCITWMVGRMERLVGLEWAPVFGRDTRVPVINDAHAAMLGEVWLGAAKGCDDVVMLTLGTGVGGAILSGGRLLQGHTGRAGHLGHISLDPDGPKSITNCPGALEHAIGNYTIKERSNGQFASTHELIDAYRAGDKEAARIWLKSIDVLAAGIASLINAVDPQVVVLAGGITQADDALFEPLNQRMDEIEWRPFGPSVPIVKATAGEFAGAIGAAKHALGFAAGSH